VLSSQDIQQKLNSTVLAQEYLQKPSIQELKDSNAIFAYDSEEMSMIDTGIVVFTGSAFHRLIDLVHDPDIAQCTAGHAYRQSISHADTPLNSSDLQLDLYSDILLAYSLARGSSSFASYLGSVLGKHAIESEHGHGNLITQYQNSADTRERSLVKVWQSCHEFSLYVVSVFDGIFLHLGTSLEYLDLVTTPSPEEPADTSTMVNQRLKHLQAMRLKYGCKHTVCSIIEVLQSQSSTLVCSIVQSSSQGSIGKGSLVEYSILYGNFSIGSKCILSNISDTFGENIIAYDQMMIQQVPLAHDALSKITAAAGFRVDSQVEYLVHIVLGVGDDIKASYSKADATICGVRWPRFFSVSFCFAAFESVSILTKSESC
jgi:hypothetical protein